jgi:hypothetical protein
MKYKFLIYSDFFKENFGGHRILHKLGNSLKSVGEEVYSFCEQSDFVKYPKMNIDDFNPNDTIVVYPEIVKDNPLNAKYVVRWMLNDQMYDHDERDLLFRLFSSGKTKRHSDHLLIFDFDSDKDFWTTDNSEKQINFFMMRKAVGRTDNPREYLMSNHQKIVDLGVYDLPSLMFDEYKIDKTFEQIRSDLRRTKYFISFDILSFWNTIASMCGAISVVIPSVYKPSSEFYSDHIYKNGVAYGFDDIDNSSKTKNKIYDYFCQLESQNLENASKFRDKCYNYFNKM